MDPDAIARPVARDAGGALRAAALVVVAGALALAAAGWSARAVSRPERRPLAEPDRIAISEAVKLYLAIGVHLRASGGDVRYAERLPAEPDVSGELMGEVRLLALAQRVETPKLVRLDVVEVRSEGRDRAQARTKEYWITSEARADRPPRSDVVPVKYGLRRRPDGWKVVSWDLDVPGSSAGEG